MTQDKDPVQELKDEIQRLEKDNATLRTELEAARAPFWTRWRPGAQFGIWAAKRYAGSDLEAALRKFAAAMRRWTPGQPLPEQEALDVGVEVAKRFLWKHTWWTFVPWSVTFLVAVITPFLLSRQNTLIGEQTKLLARQNSILDEQSALLRDQGRLMSRQTELVQTQTDAIGEQTSLFTDQNALLSTQTRILSEEGRLLDRQTALIETQTVAVNEERQRKSRAIASEFLPVLADVRDKLDRIGATRARTATQRCSQGCDQTLAAFAETVATTRPAGPWLEYLHTAQAWASVPELSQPSEVARLCNVSLAHVSDVNNRIEELSAIGAAAAKHSKDIALLVSVGDAGAGDVNFQATSDSVLATYARLVRARHRNPPRNPGDATVEHALRAVDRQAKDAGRGLRGLLLECEDELRRTEAVAKRLPSPRP